MEIKQNNNEYAIWDLQIGELPKKIYVEAVHDDFEGFRILLRGNSIPEKIVRIKFDSVLSYRNTDESYLLKIWEVFPKHLAGKIFYIVENSSFLKYIHEQTYDSNIGDLKHYAIYTSSDCIDIIATSNPIIEILE